MDQQNSDQGWQQIQGNRLAHPSFHFSPAGV